ncbi:hypothetical protein G6F56_014383 [Rhizopus delemar]|nr:hypothetical protein G6F56_014383 [Rhizopus delemar]
MNLHVEVVRIQHSQSPDGVPEEERVISYNSRTLRPAGVNYATVHLEALAIIWAVEKYRHYLMGRHFKLRTDNAALVFVMNPTKPSPKMARWAACLANSHLRSRT